MKKRILSLLLAALLMLSAGLLSACGQQPSEPSAPADEPGSEPTAEPEGAVSNFIVPEGGYDGSEVTIGSLIDKPTILLPIYFTCPNS